MSKILVNAPTGIQELIEIGEGGGYYDVSRIIWDERIDGVLPAITVGGMVRQNNQLIFDSQLFSNHQIKFAELNTPLVLTKEELMAELAAITSKINALE
jgi:hypothetical protein